MMPQHGSSLCGFLYILSVTFSFACSLEEENNTRVYGVPTGLAPVVHLRRSLDEEFVYDLAFFCGGGHFA